MITSYHVHSNFSDGIADMEKMVLAAIDANLDEVGLSDHYLLLPGEQTQEWSMPPGFLPRYVEKVLELKEKYKDKITVRLGIEADYIPETVDLLQERLNLYPFDYRIGSIHIADGFPIDNEPSDWEDADPQTRDNAISSYWRLFAELARSGVYDIAGHLDLFKKFGSWEITDHRAQEREALDAIAEAGMSLELNTSGWYKTAQEQYPSERILLGCKQRGIPIIATADAHNPKHIRRDIDRAHAMLEGLGITERISYNARKIVTTAPIGD